MITIANRDRLGYTGAKPGTHPRQTALADLPDDWRSRLGAICQNVFVGKSAPTIRPALLVTSNSTDTRWFRSLAEEMTAMVYTKGRIKFNGKSPTRGSVVFLFGGGDSEMAAMAEMGEVIVRVEAAA